ncbi:uncharacterized protein ARMOST_00562 [Armillaria ostoyae]|uniref:DDE-1 domain-containing protein n=1 Tax=Armillaria ostoyae TaxID=47428 RepID=A0A284QLK3_ARMOS|nr:uncharacterized protein ARMOST_00562 [Armillaria ostoyae]
MEDIKAEHKRIWLICAEYELKDIYNMDETGLFYGMPPDCGLADKKHSGVKGSKVHLTYAFTANADGSNKLEPFIIGKAKRLHAFGRKFGNQLGFYYRNNAKAWMMTILYQEWILKWDAALRLEKRKILLWQDNFLGHIVPHGLQCIRVENFEPNMTSHIQLNDTGIIHCFKAHYRSSYIQHAINCYDQNILPAEIYDINQLEAMWLANTAWKAVNMTTIKHCWQKAGILAAPSTPSTPMPVPDPIADVKKDVQESLDALQDTAWNEEEVEEACDADASGDECIVPIPSRKEALKAVSTLQQYVGGMDDPFLCQLEGILALFGQKTCLEEAHSLKDTEITLYFTSK